jgi:hypothetical protein
MPIVAPCQQNGRVPLHPRLVAAMFTIYALDTYFAPHLSELSACHAPPTPGWDKAWLAKFLLNSTSRLTVKERAKQLMVAYLRKVEAGLEEYELARAAMLAFVENGPQNISSYFRGLRHFENCLAMAYQAAMVFRALFNGGDLFKKDDGTAFDRLHKLYNDSKHVEGAVGRGDFPHPQATVLIWLTNDGLASQRSSLTFAELHLLLTELAEMADKIANLSFPGASVGEASAGATDPEAA